MAKDVLVYIELKDRSVRKVSYEAIEAGKRLRKFFSSKLHVAIIGFQVEILAEYVKGHADYVHVVDEEYLTDFTIDNYAEILHMLVEKTSSSFVIGSHAGYGRFILPKLSGMLDWAILADVTGFELENGRLLFKKPLFGGRVLSYVEVKEGNKVVTTLRPNSFSVSEPSLSGEVIREKIETKKDKKIRFLRAERKEEKKVDLQEADFIICGGRGMKAPENFKILEEIADIMGGRVGASRSVVDANWREYEEQIGKSGKTVSPVLYIGCGVSGAIHHTMGIDTSKTIVAINSDPNAPIFNIADYGIVDDIFAILPVLKEELKKAKEEV
ncbi:MAG: electron transfer flavoprotein subunit alpha/FixB family protein [Deltaproteobacteria bacterium]|nr:electron transfer flavoprotein subunit alpha/FixB family protein [Deltaproteobacteria bacterium]